MVPFDKEHNQEIRRRLAEEGKEYTIDQVIALRKEAFANLRAKLKAGGMDVPDDDKEFFYWVKDRYAHHDTVQWLDSHIDVKAKRRVQRMLAGISNQDDAVFALHEIFHFPKWLDVKTIYLWFGE